MKPKLKLQLTDTGLKYPMWIGKIDNYHIPRIKVSNIPGVCDENDYSILDIDRRMSSRNSSSKSIPEDDLNKINTWINVNYDDLMLLWWMFDHELTEVMDDDTKTTISYRELIQRLKKIDYKEKSFMGIKFINQ